ncbi:HlyD family secretion protein [Pseudosulfitobacter sp. DSM 107133]|uniref:HlyD family secretion protein n=1 Tax=Pseudosulfitobacter sp. DSM 107133 TaxID=2883100 RepID=UPI000DF1E912|nr:HlyD family secretion protein [Pseudosulfitobacter sp. DSM 107133]UOA28219.1 putative multidrug resistance protein EmrK [Pseudosulfitobacter sp. DSM 107133]
MNARPDPIAPATEAAPAPKDAQPPAPTRGRRRLLMLSVPLVLVLAGAGAWLFGGRYITTDNAYIHQPMTTISPDVSGRVSDVLVTENQSVTAGTPLFRLDPTDYRIALDTADAGLASARLAVAQQRAAFQTAQAQLQASKAIEDVKDRELKRQQQLTDRGIGTQASLDEATIAFRSASNAVTLAQRQLDAAAAALGGDPEADTDTLPSVRAALAAREAAERHLKQTEISAASDGTVSQIESLNVGQFIAAGTGIATLVDSGQTWVEANFKETQLAELHPGQPVTIDVDAYPGLELTGTVESLASATGSQFSLIPAQNATGNWVKVVQRVPVRIQIQTTADRPLRDGMSVSVSVDTGHDRLERLK